MKFRGKTYQIKFDNLAMFKLASADVHAGDLLIGKNSVPARFCAAWAAMLGVEFDGDEKAFLDGLIDYMQGRVTVEKAGEYYFPF